MQIKLQDSLQEKLLNVSDETQQNLLNLLIENILAKYKELNPGLKTMAQMAMRELLKQYERRAYANGATKEQAANFRPGKGQDSVEKGIEILVYGMQHLLEHAAITISYDDHDIVTDIYGQFENNGQTG